MKNRLLFCITFLFAFLCIVGTAFAQIKLTASQLERRDQIILQADALRKEGKNEEALKLINQSFWLEPDCGQCFAFRAGIRGNLAQFKEGLMDAHMGVQKSIKPRDKALSAYNMGFNLEGLKRANEALSAYEDCIRFDETFPMCYFGKGKALNSLHLYKEALKPLETAIQLNTTHGPSWAYKAIAEAALGMGIQSAADGVNAVKFAPNDPRSYMARAQGVGTLGLYDEMLKDATKALELDPKRPGAHFLRAQALKGLGRNEEAAREFDLEPDREAVAKFLHPLDHMNMRLYNCGDFSTEIQTPDKFNIDGFNDCVKRINDALDEKIRELEALPTPKRSVPGLPQRKANNK